MKPKIRINKRLAINLIIAVFLFVGSYLAIKFAKGYRPNLAEIELRPTGLLSATSVPRSSQVFINGKLTTATDDTLNLPPAEYKVEIKKDGYHSWEKTLLVEKEIVTSTNARLFPAVADLRPLTYTGALNPLPSPDGSKTAYQVASASGEAKNGLWIIDLVDRPLTFSQAPRQIANNTTNINFTKAKLLWSPDSKQILAYFIRQTPEPQIISSYLLEADRSNSLSTLLDVTAKLPLILSDWQDQLALQEENRQKILPEEFLKIATQSAQILFFSPDEKKLLYLATDSAKIPEKLIPPLPGSNTQPEEREIKPNRIYVYDLEEDKNFFIAETRPEEITPEENPLLASITQISQSYSPLFSTLLQWFPDSWHLIQIQEKEIIISEYDGANPMVIYANSAEEHFTYPWPNGSKLVILTSLNPTTPPNLYAINLK